MSYSLDDKLVIGVASSALFDLEESDRFFKKNGEAEYRIYQNDRIDDTLGPGVAFPFIRKLLKLNDLRPGDPLVEVIVLSQNDPSTGLRVLRSIETHDIDISRAVFTQGIVPYKYISAFSMSLFLSAEEESVKAAMWEGFPAGLVLDSHSTAEDSDDICIALDFDGVVASDESEQIFQNEGGLPAFQTNEKENRVVPLSEGPLRPFLEDLNKIQRFEQELKAEDPEYVPRLRISIVTARNSWARERVIHTLNDWGITVNDAFFLGGIPKGKVLEVMKPDIFFDDQRGHLASAAPYTASVHIPYGVANEAYKQENFEVEPAQIAEDRAELDPPLADGSSTPNEVVTSGPVLSETKEPR